MTGENFRRVAVVGGGSWGTAFAGLLAARYRDVPLWVREEEVLAQVRELRENRAFLPGIPLPEGVRPTNDLAQAVADRGVVAFAVPSQYLRAVAEKARPHLREDAVLVSLAKGLEKGTLLRMTEVLAQAVPGAAGRVAVLSGPTFAREVAQGKPAGATVASRRLELARSLQEALSGSRFRLYADADTVGIEIGGALKNVIAVAAGMADALEFGNNARALLISRGLKEIARVGVALGAHPATFHGLSGLGDLVLTCTGDLSRNRSLGLRIGRGERGSETEEGTGMVAEGYETSRAAVDLSRRTGVAMPIAEQVHRILHEGKEVRAAVEELFARSPKLEKE